MQRPRPSPTRGRDPNALFSTHRSNGLHGCNSSCPPVIRHRVYKLLLHATSPRHSRNGHGQSELYGESDNAYIGRLVGPFC